MTFAGLDVFDSEPWTLSAAGQWPARASERPLPVVTRVEFCCNGSMETVEVPGDRLLLDVLRDNLRLTGAKLGCGAGGSGAVRSCSAA